MEKRAVRTLLPGVSPEVPLPAVVFASKKIVRRARLLAALRDAFDLMLLGGVDYLFVRWPSARVPLLTRNDSLLLLLGVNGALLCYLWLCRAFPRWNARRVAATWCSGERERFFER